MVLVNETKLAVEANGQGNLRWSRVSVGGANCGFFSCKEIRAGSWIVRVWIGERVVEKKNIETVRFLNGFGRVSGCLVTVGTYIWLLVLLWSSAFSGSEEAMASFWVGRGFEPLQLRIFASWLTLTYLAFVPHVRLLCRLSFLHESCSSLCVGFVVSVMTSVEVMWPPPSCTKKKKRLLWSNISVRTTRIPSVTWWGLCLARGPHSYGGGQVTQCMQGVLSDCYSLLWVIFMLLFSCIKR